MCHGPACQLLTRLSTVIDIDADPTGSAQARRAGHNAAVAFVLRNPIVGAGLGSDVLAINEELGPTWSPVHNVYLQYAVDLGLPGLTLFLLLFFYCLKSVRAACRLTADLSRAPSTLPPLRRDLSQPCLLRNGCCVRSDRLQFLFLLPRGARGGGPQHRNRSHRPRGGSADTIPPRRFNPIGTAPQVLKAHR